MNITLSNGTITIISDDDCDLVNRKWYLNSNGYAMGYILGSAKRVGDKMVGSKQETLHSVILTRSCGPRPVGFFADHINRDKLDNRRENLRWVSIKENSYNHAGSHSNTGFKGVYKMKNYSNKYTASIKSKHIGTFDSAEEAAKAYDKVAFSMVGKCAYLNFPQKLDASSIF